MDTTTVGKVQHGGKAGVLAPPPGAPRTPPPPAVPAAQQRLPDPDLLLAALTAALGGSQETASAPVELDEKEAPPRLPGRRFVTGYRRLLGEVSGAVNPNAYMRMLQQIKGTNDFDALYVTEEDKMEAVKRLDPAIASLWEKRSDISFHQALSLAGSMSRPNFRKFADVLLRRSDIFPGDILNMTGKIKEALKGKGDDTVNYALSTASKLLVERKDLKPDELGRMFALIGENSGSAEEAMSAIFTSRKLLRSRRDIKPEAVGHLFEAIAHGLEDPEMKTEAFSQAADTLMGRSDLQPGHLARLFGVVSASAADEGTIFKRFMRANRLLAGHRSITPEMLEALDPSRLDEVLAGAPAGSRGGGSKMVGSADDHGAGAEEKRSL